MTFSDFAFAWFNAYGLTCLAAVPLCAVGVAVWRAVKGR